MRMWFRRKKWIRSAGVILGLLCLVVTLPLADTDQGVAGADPVGVVRGPGGRVAVLDAFSAEGGLVYVAPETEGGQPLVLLIDSVGGASWRLVPDAATGEARFLPGTGEVQLPVVEPTGLDDPRSGRNDARQARGRALAAGILDAIREEVADAFPASLARLRAGLEPVTPLRQRLRAPSPGAFPMSGCLSAGRDCDQCCEDRWRDDRDDCRNQFPGLNQEEWVKKQRCLQHAALELANCTLRCSLKDVKPVKP